jgi:uncharacterized protein YraI
MGKSIAARTIPALVSALFSVPATVRSSTRISLTPVIAAALLGAVLLLAACGPGTSQPDEATLEAQLQSIAQAYQAGGSLEEARVAIDALPLANPRQWLAVKAEEAINGDQGEAAAAVVKLAVDLNTASGVVLAYAAANGLVAATATPAPLVQATPIAVATTPTAEPAATAALLVAADTAATTGTLPIATVAVTTEVALNTLLPTATAPAAAASASSAPRAVADALINVRSGPGTEYTLVGALQPAEAVAIVAKNPAGDWWEVTLPDGQTGWVLGQLVQSSGDTGAVAVAVDIPAPPPTATPAPVVAAEPVAQATDAAAAPAATETAAPTATTDPNAKPYFKLVAKRMWSKAENGDCRGQHLLRLHVIDANGIRLNGVRLKGVYTGEIMVTGSQGKGDGVIEYDLYSGGEGFEVIQNDDGREAASDRAEGFTTNSLEIPVPTLIEGGYCSSEADCQIFYSSYGCDGHHSWEATLQRNY